MIAARPLPGRQRLAATLALVSGLFAPAGAAALEVKPEARLHLDYADHNPDVKPLDNGWIVRRATLGVKGKIDAGWSFEIAYELANKGNFQPAEGEFKDVALAYEAGSATDVTLGQFKLPFSLEELTSSNDTLFVERALPVEAIAPSRRLGVGVRHAPPDYTVSAMAFGQPISGDHRGYGVAGRVTYAPVRSGEQVLHLGLAAVIENPQGKVDFDAPPEDRVADEDLVNTGAISDVSRIDRVGLEAAWRWSAFLAQGEWLQARLLRDDYPNARFYGGYLAASWVLTGEERSYKDGRFKGITPKRSTGAWELTARLSRIDLDDGPVRGGHERNLTLGVNYYYGEHVRVMLNYIRVQSQRRGVVDDPSTVLLRLQWAL